MVYLEDKKIIHSDISARNVKKTNINKHKQTNINKQQTNIT